MERRDQQALPDLFCATIKTKLPCPQAAFHSSPYSCPLPLPSLSFPSPTSSFIPHSKLQKRLHFCARGWGKHAFLSLLQKKSHFATPRVRVLEQSPPFPELLFLHPHISHEFLPYVPIKLLIIWSYFRKSLKMTCWDRQRLYCTPHRWVDGQAGEGLREDLEKRRVRTEEGAALTIALHQRQRQSCSLRTLPHVLSQTAQRALTGRFPSSHWWGMAT